MGADLPLVKDMERKKNQTGEDGGMKPKPQEDTNSLKSYKKYATRQKKFRGLFFFFFVFGAGNYPAAKIAPEPAEPVRTRVIGFSLQLAINQHQFSLHALGYCHLCKDEF